MLKKLIAAAAAVVVAYTIWHGATPSATTSAVSSSATVPTPALREPTPAPVPAVIAAPQVARAAGAARADTAALERAIAAHGRNVYVEGDGVVAKVLRDDTQGSRHQRFLLRTSDGRSLLVAYNLDIAPRITGLRPGGTVSFGGEYVWNPRGGVLHWTHRDPAHHHRDGFIRYDGHLYH